MIRYKKIIISAVFLFRFGLTGIQAQEAISTVGGDASGSGGSVSYTLGQVVYIYSTEINGSTAQGVQQAYEISVETGIEETKGITLQCSTFPNPATDYVILKIEKYKTENLRYQLYDVNGRLLENKNVEGNETSIVMSNLVSSTYLLKVIQRNKEVKVFKIIKH